MEAERALVSGIADEEVTWSFDPIDPWHVAFIPDIGPLRVVADGEVVLDEDGRTRVDAAEVRAKVAE